MSDSLPPEALKQRRHEDKAMAERFAKVEQFQNHVVRLILLAIAGVSAVLLAIFHLYFVLAELLQKAGRI